MSSSWIRTGLRYAALLAPTVFLAALVALVALGAAVTGVLRDPARFADAPRLIQKLTKAVYWHTRRHWHTVPECVLFDPELLYRPRPGSCVFENAEFSTTMHFDARGARVTPTPAPAAAEQGPLPRVVVVGDSHAMGWGVQDHETFASILAREYGYRTVNLAVSSYGTPRELSRLRRDAVLEPGDVVVIQYCDNDLAENRHFAESGEPRRYEPAALEALLNYRPARVAPLPVAGVILRLAWKDVVDAVRGAFDESDPATDPTSAFLKVLEAYPELEGHAVLVVAINGPLLGTHLDHDRLAAAGFPLLVPDLSDGDFLDIDDHMRPRGHRAVAAALDAAIRGRDPAR
jgi:hypothetical protein